MDTVKIESKQTKIIAHRGLSGIERENTCPAFVAACNRSYFGVETDVHVTGDKKFVIIHDETTERVSNGAHIINVEENDYSAVQDIILPDSDGSVIRRDIRIPLLSEYISICKKYNKVCVLELKNRMEDDDLKAIFEEIKSLDYIENVIFISFSFENCVFARKQLPQNEIQWLTDADVTEEMIKKLVDSNMNLDIYHKKLTKENIAALHSNGIKVNCWTCDDAERAKELIDFGVDFITTNILE